MSSVSSTSADIGNQYMTLLLAQLQNQNPLDPMDNSEMSSQLTMLSQLEQMETLNATFADVLTLQQNTQATDLIGKEISFYGEDSNELTWATVEGVVTNDGDIQLVAGGYEVGLSEIVAIIDTDTSSDSFSGVEATEWLGKEITFVPSDSDSEDTVTGTVEQVQVVDGKMSFIVGDYTVALAEIQSVGLNE